ncbi:type 3 dihydrofolate reductase [Microbulbifer flavimaris]|uniref:Dihydrofolate reductase n=1 Tax=Microbulbifer flavimaris TaxID=1781068 RepID=A0ABX4I1K8_9GAMM|nr:MULTISPECIES: type 3 dihydrofolate reductase [Microbulbifer]KUJ83660.1 dihydrofolate reductase [Microbulbifer sp. ZGT114]PCO05822.1 type 3 dihydrofolate reductase [Microbulbifer flavimaris]
MKDVPIAMIAAMARNRAIGRENALPWRISGDLKFFKRVTMGKPVVMGRKTFESIGRPLPGRLNIVITRNAEWHAEGVSVVTSLEEALRLAGESARLGGAEEVMVIGGAEIYRQALPLAKRLYVTEVDADVEGDAFFPEFAGGWSETRRDCYSASDRDEYNYCLVQYDRSK